MKFSKLTAAFAALCSSLLLAGCGDTTNIGSSLVQNNSCIVVEDGFTLEATSVESQGVQSRTILQLLGSIDAKEYGQLSSDYVTQFMPVARLDTVIKSVDQIDSCKLLLMFSAGQFVGDSVVPMGLDVYMLNKQLPTPIFSDFDPQDYYDPTPVGSKIYGGSMLSAATDSIAKLKYREIYIKMPNSLYKKLYDLYESNPSAYLNPTEFAKYFPGVYVKNSYGSGRVTKIGATAIQFYYHWDTVNSEGRDTTYKYVGNFFQATPEIVSNNIIRFNMSQAITDRIDNGEKLIVAPAGYDVEIKFPIKEVMDYYEANRSIQSVINGLTLSIPVESISNTYGINPPTQLLMVLKNKRKEFFEKSQLTNDLTSFYATFNSTTGSYDFSSLRKYMVDAISRYDELKEEDWTFVLTPVYIETEATGGYYSSTTLIKTITPYVENPSMARLRTEDAKITLTFTNQNSSK